MSDYTYVSYVVWLPKQKGNVCQFTFVPAFMTIVRAGFFHLYERSAENTDDLEHHLSRTLGGWRTIPDPRKLVHGVSEGVFQSLSDCGKIVLNRFVLNDRKCHIAIRQDGVSIADLEKRNSREDRS